MTRRVIGLYYLDVLTLLYKRYQLKIYTIATQIRLRKKTAKPEDAHRFEVCQYQLVEQEHLLSSAL